MAAPLSPSCTSWRAITRLSTLRNSIPLNSNHVDLNAADRQHVEQRLDEPLRHVMKEKCSVAQVDADDSERLLLQRGLGVEHAHMHEDLAGLIVRTALKLDSHPAVALVRALEAARDHGVGEGKKRGRVAAGAAQPLDIQLEFPVEHRLKSAFRDIALAATVDRIADLHVVG